MLTAGARAVTATAAVAAKAVSLVALIAGGLLSVLTVPIRRPSNRSAPGAPSPSCVRLPLSRGGARAKRAVRRGDVNSADAPGRVGTWCGMTSERGRDGAVVLGLIAPSGMPRELADQIRGQLPGGLGNRVGDENWQVRVAAAERADMTPTIEALKQAVRRRMQDEGWPLAVALTDLPLRANRRPVTAHASAMYRVGLLSVPALGARSVPRRAMQAVLNLVEGLLGEEVGRGSDAGETGRTHRMRQRLDELRSPLGRGRADEDGRIAFVGATLRGNLRLLVGMVRANQPERVIARLSRALAVSLGTAAYAMTSSSIWMLSHGMAWPRLAVLEAASIVTLCVVLVLAHGLWERASGPDDRESVVLFNLTTSATLGLAVLTLYASLLALSVVGGAGLIPPTVYRGSVGHAPAVADYLKLGWLAATIATAASALGSLIESDEAVREAAYRHHADTRTEENEDQR